jgi:hypothetical protein
MRCACRPVEDGQSAADARAAFDLSAALANGPVRRREVDRIGVERER